MNKSSNERPIPGGGWIGGTYVPEWLGDEEEALRQAGEIGSRHGYGNLIAHLMREWQLHLMAHGLDEDAARTAVMNREPYPLDYHRPESVHHVHICEKPDAHNNVFGNCDDDWHRCRCGAQWR